MKRPWRGVAYWFAPHGLLGLIEQNSSPGWIHHGELGSRMLTEKTCLSGWPVVHLLGWWQTWGPSSHRESWGWWQHSQRTVGAQLEDPASSHLGPGWLFYLRFFFWFWNLCSIVLTFYDGPSFYNFDPSGQVLLLWVWGNVSLFSRYRELLSTSSSVWDENQSTWFLW